MPRCDRAPECGDGYSCDEDRLCRPATGDNGDVCRSEVECQAGLSCQIANKVEGESRTLHMTCSEQFPGRPTGAQCRENFDCRNGTCALGHCIDLCRDTRDCPSGTSCAVLPHPLVNRAIYSGCLPSQGTLTWPIPMTDTSGEVLLPVPNVARSAQLVMTVPDPTQKVGATRVLSQKEGTWLYNAPCSPNFDDPPCSPSDALDGYFANPLRHLPSFGQSVLLIPSGSSAAIGPRVYRVDVSSFQADDSPGSAIPKVTAVVRLDAAAHLDLHFFFLDLDEHPCAVMMDRNTLDAQVAQVAPYFQNAYLGELRAVFSETGIVMDTMTFENITNHPELDALEISKVGNLLRLGKYATGINVFFVRSLSPVGLQAYGPNPGPAGIAGTRESGIVIGLDTLCYRDWSSVARLTAHEIARYMGLYHNVELDHGEAHPTWQDQIDDNNAGDPTANLMYFSEFGGTQLTRGQIEILLRSPVLR